MPPLKYWKPTRTPLGERTTSRPRGGWVVRATAETALPCGAVCEVEDGGGGALKAPSRSAEREDGRQGHAELELRASRARVGELERNEEVLKQQLSHCLEDAAAQQELVRAARIAASEEAERLEASVSQLRAQARPFSPPSAPPRPELTGPRTRFATACRSWPRRRSAASC